MKFLYLFLTISSFIACQSNQPKKSFKPGQPWLADDSVHINAHGGGILYHEGVYYWYGQYMVAGDAGNRAQVGVSVYSSENLYDWKNQGIALSVVEKDTSHDIAKGCILERPKVIYNDSTHKFVMWFHLELRGQGYDAARSGVAVADNPIGPFTYLRSFRPNAGHWPVNVQDHHKRPVADTIKDKYCGGKGCLPAHPDSLNLLGRDFEGGQMARDMNLFVDDDGKAYHIYSSEENSTLHISQLTGDYLGYSGQYARVFADRYMEAATILRKSDGTYYLIASDCTGWAPNAARSAKATSIFGPWEELGNPCRGADSATSFRSQSTYLLSVQGLKDAFIYIGDRWTHENPIEGGHIWLPVEFEDGKLILRWYDEWDLSFFKN